MNFNTKVSVQLPFKLDLTGMTEREKFLRSDWFWWKEPETLAWIDTFEENSVFWDIGANIGVFSLYAALSGKNIHCFAFEPFAPNYDRLKRNIDLNEAWNNIRPEKIALSDECGMANFESKTLEIGSSGGQIGRTAEFIQQNAFPVNVVTGDTFAIEHGVPDYIKIDVDGQEPRVLAGMEKTLADKRVKGILIEDNSSASIIDKLILGYGFKHAEEFERLKLRQQAFNKIYRRK